MPIEFTDKPHYYQRKKKVFRIGMNVSQATYAEKGDWLPCYSLLCQRQLCRFAFRELRFEPALRMKARNSNLRMYTASKMSVEALNQHCRQLVDALRERGHTVESIAALEPHRAGLFHLHQLLDTDASDAVIAEVAAELLELNNPEVKIGDVVVDVATGEVADENAIATEWTTIALTEKKQWDVAYPFKNLNKGLGKAHLELNGGKPYNFMTRGFFTSVGGLKGAAKAERELNRVFKEELAPRFGAEATKISDTMCNAQEMLNYIRDDIYKKAVAMKNKIAQFTSLGLNMTTHAIDEALRSFESLGICSHR